jgi:hypothetical protein
MAQLYTQALGSLFVASYDSYGNGGGIRTHVHTDDLPLPSELIFVIYTNSDRSSQERHYVSATKPNRLMLFRETVAVYCENHTEHTDTVYKNEGFFNITGSVPYSYHCAINGQ